MRKRIKRYAQTSFLICTNGFTQLYKRVNSAVQTDFTTS